MELEVLGNWAGSPGAGSACSGYLVTEGRERLLLDCGPGVVPALQHNHRCSELTAVFITHMHLDHCLDLLTLAYRLIRYSWRYEVAASAVMPIPLFLPQGAAAIMEHLVHAFGRPGRGKLSDPLAAAFEPQEIAPGEQVELDGVSVTCYPMEHAAPCNGLRVESANGVVAYSGDTRHCDALVDMARDADLFLCEATGRDPLSPTITEGGHLTSTQAGEVAQQARAAHLLLTHLSHQDPSWCRGLVSDAASRFTGLLEVAQAGITYPVGKGRAQRRHQVPEDEPLIFHPAS